MADRPALLGLNRRARFLLPIFMLLLVGLTLQRLWAPDWNPLIELTGHSMGTTWSLKVLVPEAAATGEIEPLREELREAVRARLARVDSLMSTFDSESELSRFNRFASLEPFALSPTTFEVFELAQQVSELTGGAFDVTVGPLVAAWGFGADDAPIQSPPPKELAALRERVGHELLALDPQGGWISKAHSELACDLSGIAKGHAVDQIVEAVQQLGYRNFLVEVGGELAARGRRPDGTSWRVAIEQPRAISRSVHAVVSLDGQGMATSGDYRNFVERDGVRLSHLIDPRVGRPIAHRLTSVTVVDPSTARADALATALSVLGPDEGFALAKREGILAYFILRSAEGEIEIRVTPDFEGLLLARPETR